MSARTEVNLTQRQSEVFRLIAAGLTNEQIAEELEFGIDNAKINVRHIFQRIGASNRAEAVTIGFTSGLLDPDDIAELREELKGKIAPAAE